MHDFRNEARKALSRAKAELDSNDDERLKYAALELRLAMEALTYDRASAYRNETPPQEYETWQPRKVMQLLLDIDPNADKNSSLAIGLEEEYGKPAKEMKMLGSEEVLNLATIKKHYDALGSYLHMPTLKQRREGGPPKLDKLRRRCNDIVEALDKALASTAFNTTLGVFTSIECSRCSEVIRKRVPIGEEKLEVRCFECGAQYNVFNASDNETKWEPIIEQIDCPALRLPNARSSSSSGILFAAIGSGQCCPHAGP